MPFSARVPIEGYRSQRNYSAYAMTWLTWIEKTRNITLKHALGEKYLGDAQLWADGFHAETNTVYSVYGCFYHDHLTCKNKPYSKTTMNPKLKRSMGDLDMDTKRWNRRVKQCGYTLITKYEYEWTDEVASDPIIREHTSSLRYLTP